MDAHEPLIPVAQYLRMSTEHQQYSIECQRAAIAKFAAENGMKVVQTFQDNGKSGLTLRGRSALQALLREVLSDQRLFEYVVVYDVSRWGRFQDVDESAFYEHICRRAGARVLYCAEPFDAVPGPMAVIMKSVKRAMAAEYSRELSAKVYATMIIRARQGYHVGGVPGFGLKRVQVSKNGDVRRDLATGERRSRTEDHVELAPGDPFDCGLVRLIFFLCVRCGLSEREIAMQLNWSCYPSRYGLMPWTSERIRALLRNERYVGTAVYGANTQRLNTTMRPVPKADQIRTANSFERVVSLREFNAAQALVGERKPRRKWTNIELLEVIRRIKAERGYFEGSMLKDVAGGPSNQIYEGRFGSLANACKAANIELTRRMASCEQRRKQRCLCKLKTIEWLAEHYRALGRTIYCHPRSNRVSIDGRLTISIRVLHPQNSNGTTAWTFQPHRGTKPDMFVFLRVTDEDELLDYFVIPGNKIRHGYINRNGMSVRWLAKCRCENRAAVIERLDATQISTRGHVPKMHLKAEAQRVRGAGLTKPPREPRFVLSARDS